MKRQYAKPSMSIDIFEANEYIATCSVATCNINVSRSCDSNVAYTEKNGIPGYQETTDHPYKKGDKRFKKDNIACGHEYTVKNVSKLKPYMHDSNGSQDGGNIQQVYYWKEGWNSHFTTGYQTTGSSTA